MHQADCEAYLRRVISLLRLYLMKNACCMDVVRWHYIIIQMQC